MTYICSNRQPGILRHMASLLRLQWILPGWGLISLLQAPNTYIPLLQEIYVKGQDAENSVQKVSFFPKLVYFNNLLIYLLGYQM